MDRLDDFWTLAGDEIPPGFTLPPSAPATDGAPMAFCDVALPWDETPPLPVVWLDPADVVLIEEPPTRATAEAIGEALGRAPTPVPLEARATGGAASSGGPPPAGSGSAPPGDGGPRRPSHEGPAARLRALRDGAPPVRARGAAPTPAPPVAVTPPTPAPPRAVTPPAPAPPRAVTPPAPAPPRAVTPPASTPAGEVALAEAPAATPAPPHRRRRPTSLDAPHSSISRDGPAARALRAARQAEAPPMRPAPTARWREVPAAPRRRVRRGFSTAAALATLLAVVAFAAQTWRVAAADEALEGQRLVGERLRHELQRADASTATTLAQLRGATGEPPADLLVVADAPAPLADADTGRAVRERLAAIEAATASVAAARDAARGEGRALAAQVGDTERRLAALIDRQHEVLARLEHRFGDASAPPPTGERHPGHALRFDDPATTLAAATPR